MILILVAVKKDILLASALSLVREAELVSTVVKKGKPCIMRRLVHDTNEASATTKQNAPIRKSSLERAVFATRKAIRQHCVPTSLLRFARTANKKVSKA